MRRKYISTQTTVHELSLKMDILAGSPPTITIFGDYEVTGDQVLTRRNNVWENDEDEDNI